MKYILTLCLITLLCVSATCRKNRNGFEYGTSDSTVYPVDTIAWTPGSEDDVHYVPYRAEGEYLPSEYKGAETKHWDLIRTELEIEPDFLARSLKGMAIVSVKPHFYAQDSLVLDARNMDIYTVEALVERPLAPGATTGNQYHKVNYRYTDSTHLVVYFDNAVPAGMYTGVKISYTAFPYRSESIGGVAISGDRGMYFINHDLKDPVKPRQMWTQGETESNSGWFPTLDAPNQKMTQKIRITVPDTMVSLSNGLLKNSIKLANGKRQDFWEQTLPHAPYLCMVAAGNWSIIKDQWKGKEVNYYVEKQFAPYARLVFGKTPEMIEFFSNYTGVPYAWDKYSQVVIRDFVSGAMENTGAVTHMEQVAHTPRQHWDETYEEYVSHELFHHWFGDLVTSESWSNITLNESWATYGQYLWREYKYGRDNADDMIYQNASEYNYYGYTPEKRLVRYDYDSPDEMFDNVSYQKGACILHMLRKTIGDEAFRAGIKTYLEENKFQSAEVAQLRIAFEKVTGKDLAWFFNQWYFDMKHPVIQLTSAFYEDDSAWLLNITQTQTHRNTYILPVKLKYSVGGVVHEEELLVNERDFAFQRSGPKPDWFIFDADNALLADVHFEHEYDPMTVGAHIDMLKKAWKNTTLAGVKLDLLNLAIQEHNSMETEAIPELHAAMYEVLQLALHSGNRYLVEVAADELHREDGPFKTLLGPTDINDLKAILKDRSLGKDARRSIMSILRDLSLPDVDWMELTSDSSISVATRAVFNLFDEDYWYPIAQSKVLSETEPAIILTWASKMHFAEKSTGAEVIKQATLNPHLDISSFSEFLSQLMIYGTDYAVIEEVSHSLIERNDRRLLSGMPGPLKERIAMLKRVLSNDADWDAEEKEKNLAQLAHYEALLKQIEEVLAK